MIMIPYHPKGQTPHTECPSYFRIDLELHEIAKRVPTHSAPISPNY